VLLAALMEQPAAAILLQKFRHSAALLSNAHDVVALSQSVAKSANQPHALDALVIFVLRPALVPIYAL
jgi:hypothetical protein